MSYGLITKVDALTIEKTLDLVCKQFDNVLINTTEVGIDRGHTSRAINKYLTDKGRINFHTAIDNQRDRPIELPFQGCNLIIGNSLEVYNQLEDNSQHFIFIDACHNYAMTMADFLVYSDKVRHMGFIALHDCGKQIKPRTDYQGMGSKDDDDQYISCRKAAIKLGLLVNKLPEYDLIFDEYDETFPTGGIIVVQKIGF